MSAIRTVLGRTIFDSRGTPTVEVDVILESGAMGRAAVPSGASTGSHEAIEVRDGGRAFGGKGVGQAVHHVNALIATTLCGMDASCQKTIDQVLCALDGTTNKKNLGANAILGVSLAVAHAAAHEAQQPLYRFFGKGKDFYHLPVPLMNILNGGVHADNPLDIQEFMIVPIGASSFSEAMKMGIEVFLSLKAQLKAQGMSTNVGDEGGFAPDLRSASEALDLLMRSIEVAGLRPCDDIALALDVAATELYEKKKYRIDGKSLSSEDMAVYYQTLTASYPIISIEDGLAEDDWEGWRLLTHTLGHTIQLVGDDLFVTSKKRLLEGTQKKAANAILIKPNQVGTLSETIETIECAHTHGFATIMSHRSGETEDTTIADLAVALNVSQIKTGSLSRTDRLAKYNQLLRIEEQLGDHGSYIGKQAFPKKSS